MPKSRPINIQLLSSSVVHPSLKEDDANRRKNEQRNASVNGNRGILHNRRLPILRPRPSVRGVVRARRDDTNEIVRGSVWSDLAQTGRTTAKMSWKRVLRSVGGIGIWISTLKVTECV
ncbi:hypothetical protein Trydic_g94 [Trypoxylus dichotomus]